MTGNPEDNKLNGKGVSIKIVPISSAKNIIEKPGDRKKFPNPMFYGDRILRNHVWNSQYPRIDKMQSTPVKNLAIIYSIKPFYPKNNITYPEIVADPSYFVGKNQTANIFGWCQLSGANANPSLTMLSFEVSFCDVDRIL